MTYNVFGGTLSLTQSINQSSAVYVSVTVQLSPVLSLLYCHLHLAPALPETFFPNFFLQISFPGIYCIVTTYLENLEKVGEIQRG